MARLNAANNASTTLAADITSAATSITVVDASRFPNPPFRCTIYKYEPISGEIIEVTARSGNTFTTVVRGKEGTTASAWDSGDLIEVLHTAEMYTELVYTGDSRLSDDRTPKVHGNDKHSATYVTQTEINSSISSHAGNATAHHSNVNDPTSGEKAALAGTSGTPGSTNKYVTNGDSRMTNARTPTAHKTSHAAGGSDEITPADIGAAASSHTHSYLPLAGGTVTGDLVINGNVTISGTETVVNTATLEISDNIMVLNADVTGTPTENAGIEIERGTSPNVLLRWNEASDIWEVTKNGTNYYTILDSAHAANGVTTSKITNWDAAYTHSTSSHARTDATLVQSSLTNGNIKINGTETNVYTHPTTAGNKHIPSGGAASQFLQYSADGTAVWSSVDWSEISSKPATYAPSSHEHSIIISNGSTNQITLDTNSALGIVAGSSISITYDDVNNKLTINNTYSYTHPTGAGYNHIPSGGASNQFLQYSTSGVAVWSSVDWTELSGKPSTFAPSSHTHPYTEVTGLGGAATLNVGTTTGTVAAGDDSRFHSNANDPTSDQKAALAGTSGTPSSTNKYVTNADSRLTDARTPVAHNHSATEITSGTLAVARGGTGIASYTVGNYIYASAATTLSQRTPAQVLSDIGAAASGHTHSYLPLAGGTMSSNAIIKFPSEQRAKITLYSSSDWHTIGTEAYHIAYGGFHTAVGSHEGHKFYTAPANLAAQIGSGTSNSSSGYTNSKNSKFFGTVDFAEDTNTAGDANITGDAVIGGKATIAAKYDIQYNATTNSLDFNYVG